MLPYRLLYRLGVTPWERRPVPEVWKRVLDGPDGPPPGRALDVGCGTGRDAVHLAQRGWEVTGVDAVDTALAQATARAAEAGADVRFLKGDVADLPALGLEPGYTLLYDFGCIHGLPDPARAGAAAGLTTLAAPGATLLLLAFRAGRRMILPRGMDQPDVVGLFGDAWDLQDVQPVADESMPPPVRRARPTLYLLARAA